MEPTNYFFPKTLVNASDPKHALKKHIFNQMLSYLCNMVLDALPTPNQGSSRNSIRILKEKKVLIRIAGNCTERNQLGFRKEQMTLGREVIIQNNFKHLKIPRASIFGQYLVENLIPTIAEGTLASIAYYMQNKQFFDQPVIELTKFLFKICLEDIIGNSGWMACNWPQGVPRYDNILFYEKTKNNITIHKIALIDLETLYHKDFTSKDYLKTAKEIILLFPYQFDVVINTCKNLIIFNSDEIIDLEICKESAINSIERVYKKHGDFVLNNRELAEDPFTKFLNSAEAQHRFIKELRKEISIWRNTSAKVYKVTSGNINLLNFTKHDEIRLDVAIVNLKALGDNPEKYLDYCESEILYPMLKEICEFMKNAIEMTKNQNPFTDPKMLSERVMIYGLNLSDEGLVVDVYKDNHTYSFTAKELLTKFDQTLIKPISPEIRDLTIKYLLKIGIKYFEIQRLMLNLFKKNEFIADVFKDKKFTTILF